MLSYYDEVKQEIFKAFGDNQEQDGVIRYSFFNAVTNEIINKYLNSRVFDLYYLLLMSKEQGTDAFQLRLQCSSSDSFIVDCDYLNNRDKCFREFVHSSMLLSLSVKDEMIGTIAFYNSIIHGEHFIGNFRGRI